MAEKISKSLIVLCAVFFMMFIPNVNAQEASVTTDMTNEEIQSIVDSNETVEFTSGEYQNLSLTVDGVKTFKMNGNVTFRSSDGTKFGIFFNNNVSADLTIDGDLTISSYKEGIFVSNDSNVTLRLANNTKLSLIDSLETEQNHGNGMWIGYRAIFNLIGNSGSSFIASNNAVAGINVLGYASVTLNFNNMALVDMSNNVKASGYHAGMETGSANTLNFNNVQKVTMDNNGVDAVCFSSGDNTASLNIINSKNVSMTNNKSWGTNGGDIKIVNSILNISNNSDGPWANVTYTASNMYANSLYVENSTIDANNCGANSGIWVENTATIIGSIINANSNGQKAYGNYNYRDDKPYYQGDYPWNTGNGIGFCGNVTITSSTINANENGGAGIAFYGTTINGLANVEITSSKLTANNNGVSPNFTVYEEGSKIRNWNSSYYEGRSGFNVALASGLAVVNAEVKANNSTIILMDNKENGIGYHQAYEGKVIVDGETIAAISTNDEELQKEIKGSNSGQETIVLSGSLQGNLDNMDGEYGDEWNGTKKDDETYVGPINSDGTKLTEFDVNKEINKILDKDSNKFTYYDPNTGTKYDYVFKYNDDSTDLTGEGNNAYLWTPASLLHYDATEGLINYLGTAGVLKYGNSKAIQRDLFLAGLGSRFTQDVTIYGNCMALAEKILASASREGYVFLGWYIADDSELAKKYAEEGDFEELYKLLNTQFTDMTNLEIDGVPVSELTIYAKWAKEETGKTEGRDEIIPPKTGVDFDNNIELLFVSLITVLGLAGVSKLVFIKNEI